MNNYNNPPVIAQSGTYVGNDTANRAIPHGLGRIPKLVYIRRDGNTSQFFLKGGDLLGVNVYAVTAWNSNNFYVGNAGNYAGSANGNTLPYSWTAI